MSNEVFIGIVVAVVVAVLLGIKTLIHGVLTFKMDETAIVKYLRDSSGEIELCSTEAISTGTDIDAKRVALVCSKSKLIESDSKEKASWYLG